MLLLVHQHQALDARAAEASRLYAEIAELQDKVAKLSTLVEEVPAIR
jgi:hypothetical protein